MPVAGAILKSFGDPDGFGGAEKGVSIARAARRDRLLAGRRLGRYSPVPIGPTDNS